MSQSVVVESLDLEGRGIAHDEGKAIFIEGALPGERVTYVTFKRKPNYEMAAVDALLSESAQRVAPLCPHFGVCGGCSMQHLEPGAQVATKQRVLEDIATAPHRERHADPRRVQDGAITLETVGVLETALKAKGIEIVDKKSYPLGVKDLSPVLRDFKAKNPDAFLGITYPPDTFLATAQAKEVGFNPKVFYVAVSSAFPVYKQRMGETIATKTCTGRPSGA